MFAALILKTLLFFIKVKFSLVLNEASHADVWGSGRIAPHILNLGTRYK
jgi:hypothetical protein